ncbi:MAG: translation initiation factor IF-2 [Myxococcales bacterium]|nr:translation initiation factor IF-2 [Myxococcales bacterium]
MRRRPAPTPEEPPANGAAATEPTGTDASEAAPEPSAPVEAAAPAAVQESSSPPEVEAAPQVVAEAPEPPAQVASPEPTDTPAPETANVASAEPAPVVEAAAPEPAPVPEAAPPAAPEPPPAAPEPVQQAEPPKSEPEQASAPAPQAPASPEAPAAEPVAAKAGDDKVAADAPKGEEAKPADDKENTPRYPGLGPAVVMPPPGYDPTNPMAFRRQQDAAAARAAQQAATGAGGPSRTRGRRRVEPGGDRSDFRNRRGRGGRNSGGPGGRGFDRRRGRKGRKSSGPKQASPTPKAAKRKVKVDNVISVRDLAMQLGVKAPLVIRHLMDLEDRMFNINDMLDLDTAQLVANEFDYEVENVGFQEADYLESVEDEIEEGNLEGRPPVVTIMGHVDHGKTTLLDTIRSSRVAAGEAGGITQHIGAYQVDVDGKAITFIDTPGHEAFTAMRRRGASVTDLVILVVAADDGVQPQTEEAIQHAKAAGVPVVVAVNKMDKAGVTAEAIMTRMSEFELVPEEWGGDTMYVPISALKNEGIDALLEGVLLQAELLDLRANPQRSAEGIVLEAKMERGRGAVASILVQRGTLNQGDHVVLGSAFGRVRAIIDHTGSRMKSAGPSTPVELFGLSALPEVGDSVNAVQSEKNARTLAEHREVAKRQEQMAKNRRADIDTLIARAAEEERETLLVILKADVGGSLQALKAAVEDIDVGGAEVRLLLTGVGDINESDINLAASDNAKVIGFNVKLDAKARKAATQLGVEPEIYTVIYEVLDRIEREMKGLLAPVYEQVRQGTVEVRQLFRISRVGVVAGSYVIDGKVGRNHSVKVLREGQVIWEGAVDTLRRFKDDVREVAAGYECGISLDGYDDLQEGDLIETYAEQVVEPE